ncbi:MAG TPA: hypothetical protein VER14_02225, partial [Phototrophicaceae bacterium]|nr:hypothetical protein [Phototrophicaceae bacterium]
QILMAVPGGLSSDFCLCILRHKKPKIEDKYLRQRLAENAKDVLDSLKSLAEMTQTYSQIFLEAYFIKK